MKEFPPSTSELQVLAHKFGYWYTEKVKQENSRNSRKTQGFWKKLKLFPKKTQENCQKTQGFTNSTWFLLPKNVQKKSLLDTIIRAYLADVRRLKKKFQKM